MTKEQRAQIARENGTKSKGATTAAGLEKCHSANRKHGMYARLNQTLPTEPVEAYAALRAEVRDYFQPGSAYEEGRVERLVRYHWELRRLDDARHQQYLEALDKARRNATAGVDPLVLHTQIVVEATTPCGAVAHIDSKVRYFNREISYLERDLIRNKKHLHRSGSSQLSLITKESEPELVELSQGHAVYQENPALPELKDPPPSAQPQEILTWAKEKIGFDPDPYQADLMTTESKDVLMLGGRQTGKSTAAAVRAIYEAIQHHECTVLLAGPTGRQSGQIMVKSRQIAKRLGLPLSAPPPGCDGFRLPNGSYVISLPDSEKTVRGFSAPRLIIVDEAAFASDELIKALKPMLSVSNGAMLLLTTPNGQSGYFYESWHEENGPWQRILCKASDCARIDPAVLETMSRTMNKEEYQQEFNCEFLAPPGQFISRELFRRAIRADIKPMFEED